MKLITWNVNGFRAVLKKGFEDFFHETDADIFCIQETKMQEDQVEIAFDGYSAYWNSAVKKGYSGTAIFTRVKPLAIFYGIDVERHDTEGRVITLEFDSFYLVNVYTPNSQRELARLGYRMEWEEEFLKYIVRLKSMKGVVVCGDLNVAHNEIDLKNPATNHKNAGFSDEERAKMTNLLDNGFTDCFRFLYPNVTDVYTWWSYMFSAREKNVGWRIDYFVVSDSLRDKIEDCIIHDNVMGSDHCPVELLLKVN